MRHRTVTLGEIPTPRLVAAIRQGLPVELQMNGYHLGAEEEGWADWVSAMVEGAYVRATSALYRAKMDAQAGVSQNLAWVRGELLGAQKELRRAAHETIKEGATAVGDAILVLANRAGLAATELGKGFGGAFKAWWGISPGGLLGIGTLVALLVLGGGAYLLLTPGGQALFAGVGGGIKAAGGGAAMAGPALAKFL